MLSGEERRDALFDKQARNEGWGDVTDAALGIPPSDVGTEARKVARWAYDKITALEYEIAEVQEAAFFETYSND